MALEPSAFSLAEWLPPGDPRRGLLMDEPVDVEASWVLSALKADGTHCSVCGAIHADQVVESSGRPVLVHAECARRPPEEKEIRSRERRARAARRGYPEQPKVPVVR